MARWLHRLTAPRGLALWFLLCALPTGLGCALLTPVGQVSDEPAAGMNVVALPLFIFRLFHMPGP